MKTGLHTIIPEKESHCVWMDAGLVNYKLCDKNFECETCPFDRVMRTQHHPFSERAAIQSDAGAMHVAPHDASEKIFRDVMHSLTEPLRRTKLPDDRLYFSNHSWLQRLDDGRCRIGVNDFLARFLDPVMAAVVVNSSSRIEKNSPFAWFIRDDQTYTIHSSISGMVTETNTVLSSKPSLITRDPYESGWIVSLMPNAPSEEPVRYYTAEEYRIRLDHDIHKVESILTTTLSKQRKEIGTSMFDGGVRVETIEQFIGEKRYVQLLNRLLRPHSR
jgi:glycine cleavage system H lipoate-binding protein